MSDKAIRRQQFAAVLIVAALAAVVSYSHIRDLAVTHGGDTLTSALLPLLIDGTVAGMSFAMVRAARSGDTRVPWLVRFMLVLFAGATLAANLAYGAAYGVTGALLWTLPAVAFVGCIEVMVLMVRRMQPVTAEPAAVPVVAEPRARADTLTSAGDTPGQPGPDTASGSAAARARPVKPETVPAAVTVRQTPPNGSQTAEPDLAAMTRQEQAKALNLKVRTLYRKIERGELPELANGKAH